MAVVSNPNISITRGDTYVETWACKQSDGVSILDLTGAKLWFTIKTASTVADGSATLQLSSPASGIVLSGTPTDGTATMTMTAVQTAALTPQSYVYDIQVKLSSGTIWTLASGTLTVNSDITQATS